MFVIQWRKQEISGERVKCFVGENLSYRVLWVFYAAQLCSRLFFCVFCLHFSPGAPTVMEFFFSFGSSRMLRICHASGME